MRHEQEPIFPFVPSCRIDVTGGLRKSCLAQAQVLDVVVEGIVA